MAYLYCIDYLMTNGLIWVLLFSHLAMTLAMTPYPRTSQHSRGFEQTNQNFDIRDVGAFEGWCDICDERIDRICC